MKGWVTGRRRRQAGDGEPGWYTLTPSSVTIVPTPGIG
jgi:hypothetical protein